MLLVAAIAALGWRTLEGRRIERESHTVVEAVRRVTKLSTVEMGLSNWHLRRDSKNLFGVIPFRCEKTVAVFYRGKIAAGFDLGMHGSLGIDVARAPGERHVRVRLPPPQILYTDTPAPELVVADGSICNKIEASDYERLHAEARAALQDEAIGAGILRRAEEHARQLVAEVVRPLGFTAEVVITDATNDRIEAHARD